MIITNPRKESMERIRAVGWGAEFIAVPSDSALSFRHRFLLVEAPYI